MPVIGSTVGLALFQAGVSGALVNAVTLGIANAGGLLLAAGSIGIQYAVALSNRPKPLTPEAQGIQNLIRQAIPPQRLCFGTPVTSGAMFYGAGDAPYTWYGLLLAAHEVEGLESVFINGTEVFFDGDGFATSTPFRDGSNKYLEMSFRNGSIDQAIDPIIARDFPGMPSTFRQRGHATVVFKRAHGFGGDVEAKNEDYKRVWGESGQFNPLVKFKGAKYHDPRRPGSIQSDASTHSWGENTALCLAHALTFKWPDKQIFDPSRLNWDAFSQAADECDKWETDRNGNAFHRYTANGVVQSTERTYDVLESFRSAMGGDIAIERGKIYPVPGVKRTPQATFHNGMLVGGFRFTREKEFSELVNIVKTQFLAPDRENQTVEGPVIRDTDAITADGQPLETTLQLAFVEGDPRAQRLAHMALKKSRAPRTLEIGSTNEAQSWQIGKIYRISLSGGVLEKINGLYTLSAKAWNPDLRSFQLGFREYTDEAFNFGPSDEQDFELDTDTVSAAA